MNYYRHCFVRLFFSWVVSVAALCDVCAAPEPRLAVFIDRSARNLSVISWDYPVFVSYNDRAIIWSRNWKRNIHGISYSASTRAIDIGEQMYRVAGKYEGKVYHLEHGVDVEQMVIWMPRGSITIYGRWNQTPQLRADGVDGHKGPQVGDSPLDTLPSDLQEVLTKCQRFDDARATPWRPSTFVVEFQPAGPALGVAREWPSDYPSQIKEDAQNPYMFKIQMHGALLDRVIADLGGQDGADALLVAGRRVVGRIRIQLPGEEFWVQGR